MTDTKLPLGENISDEEIKRSYNMVQDVPFDDERLSYRILIQKKWNPTSIHLQERPVISADKMTSIGMFVGSQANNARDFILLQVIELHQEVATADVLRGYALANDYKLITLQEDSPKRVDSLVEFKMQGANYLGRAVMVVTGNRVGFLLAAGSPTEYDKLKDSFSLAAASFEMPKAPQGNIEPWREYQVGENWLRFKAPFSWKFDYPSSSDLANRSGVELYNTDANNDVIGIIRIKAILKDDTTDIGAELKKFMDELEEMGVEFGEIMARHDISINDDFTEAHQVIYQILDKETKAVREAWIAIVEDDKYLSFFALLTARREDYFSVWAVNKRVWQIMLNTLTHPAT